MTGTKIRLEELTKRFPGQQKPAVDALSLEIPEGEIVIFVGPSGCGKTTTMKLINRLIEPSSGRIFLDDEDVTRVDPDRLRRRIGYVIQQIGLFPHQTIAENIATVPRLLKWDKSRIAKRVDELIETVGMDPALYRDRYPKQLSGGQRQRIGVARAMSADPDVMLMDEPFGAIDPITRDRLQNEFLRLQSEIKKTIVFVTHDIDEAIKMGDRIAVMQKGGRLAQYAPPAELLSNPANAFVEDFVGADRGLKRLSLERVRDVDLWRAPLVRDGEQPPTGDYDLEYPLVVDDSGRPLRWLSGSRAEPRVELDDVLRDALSVMLEQETQYAPVVDERGAVAGVLSIEIIGHSLAQP
jgi:osmoprotectant transport system ATP-binding protein